MHRYVFLALAFVFYSSIAAHALDVNYSNSAHGNQASRSDMPSAYATGNCAHCHEQHSSLGGEEPAPVGNAPSANLLLADVFNDARTSNTYIQSDNVCFQCHVTTGSLQNGGITNYSYSKTFGGASATVTSIMDAFNQDSYHNLYDIQRYITGASGTKSFNDYPAGSNPCSGCHNVHLARANWRTPGNPGNTALSLPSDHNNLWGDDTDERMTAWGVSAYQPLLYGSSTTMLEPDGSSSDMATQAPKTPDYSTFCIDCHNSTNTIWSTTLGRNLNTFDWALEAHGEGSAAQNASNWGSWGGGGGWGDSTYDSEMKPPYEDSKLGDYVLSCLDCHEPHGSTNSFLIRNAVNTKAVNLSVGWDSLCSSCHQGASDLESVHHYSRHEFNYSCRDCHGGGWGGEVVSCVNCHFHGSSVNSNPLF